MGRDLKAPGGTLSRTDDHMTPDVVALPSKLIWLARKILAARSEYGASSLSVARRFLTLYRHEFSPDEIFGYGLVDPVIPRDSLPRHVPKERVCREIEPLNLCDGLERINDKLVFDQICRSEGLAVPRLIGAYPDYLAKGLDGDERISPQSRDAWVAALRAHLPDAFIAKPRCGMKGYAVRLFKRSRQGFRADNGEEVSADQLLSYFESILALVDLHERFPTGVQGVLIQEVVKGHPVLAELSATEAAQTVRICTFVTPDGQVVPLFAFLKIVAAGNVVDNFSGGLLGNMIGHIDRESGALAYVFGCRPGTGLGYRLERHPQSGRPFAGVRLPYWQDTLDLACRAARVFLPSRALGWDVAITADGPVLLEGNHNWDPVVPFYTLPETEALHSRP